MFGFNTRRTQVLFWVRHVLCTSVGVLFLSLLTAVSASAVVTEPPTVGTGGTLGVLAGDPWTVCRADTSTAWLSANVGGTYNAEAICQSLGYSEVDAKGGTCGTVCGYCGTVGQETYDDSGGAITSLSSTVNWRCAGATFVPDTEGPTVTLDPVSGTYMPGDTVVLTAHLSEPITSYLNQNFIGTNATQVGAGNYSEPDLTFNVFVQIVAGGAATVQLGAGYFIDAADNASAASNVVSITVLDTVDETQDMRADFALRRAANLIRNQPDLTGMLRGQGGERQCRYHPWAGPVFAVHPRRAAGLGASDGQLDALGFGRG
ncbi:MAG: hypothetical protein PHX82_06250 [Paracoccaceae bacterium]|nr:hypothetical protein [Paracoccaceae bacterium]